MKRIALILLASVLALNGLQAQKKQKRVVNLYDVDSVVYVPDTVLEDPEYDRMWKEAGKLHMTYPINGPKKMQIEVHEVMVVMNKIAQFYGLKDEVQTKSARQPESFALISSLNIIPFRANQNNRIDIEKAPSSGEYEETDIRELIEKAKQAFRSCNISYSSGYLQGRMYGQEYNVQIVPGKLLNLLSPNTNEQLLYMEVKNKENPTLRDLFAVQWKYDGSDMVSGALYFITNRRPDLAEKDEQTAAKLEFTQSHTANSALTSVHISTRQRLALLEKLGEKYEEDIKQLQRDLFNADTSKEKRRIRKQIKPLNKKRQEVLNEMHHIIMNYRKSEKI